MIHSFGISCWLDLALVSKTKVLVEILISSISQKNCQPPRNLLTRALDRIFFCKKGVWTLDTFIRATRVLNLTLLILLKRSLNVKDDSFKQVQQSIFTKKGCKMVNICLGKDFSYRLQAGQKTHRRPVLKGFV